MLAEVFFFFKLLLYEIKVEFFFYKESLGHLSVGAPLSYS